MRANAIVPTPSIPDRNRTSEVTHCPHSSLTRRAQLATDGETTHRSHASATTQRTTSRRVPTAGLFRRMLVPVRRLRRTCAWCLRQRSTNARYSCCWIAPHACTPCLHPIPAPHAYILPHRHPPTQSSRRYAPSCSPAASRDLDGDPGGPWAHPAHACQHTPASTSLPLPLHHCTVSTLLQAHN